MSGNNLVFIDANIRDYQTLAQNLKPGTEAVVLDPHQDGVEQISKVLAERKDVASVQIFSHGDEGQVQLGSTLLDEGNL